MTKTNISLDLAAVLGSRASSPLSVGGEGPSAYWQAGGASKIASTWEQCIPGVQLSL
jgi:hypothetical protein